ncbi:MAG: DMT family transporter [Candidatus Tyrphobacter sp.]
MRLRVVLGLLYVVFAWALNTVLVKSVFTEIDPLAFMALRFIVMPPLALLLMRILGEKFHIERADIPLLVACGACGYGVYQYFWMIGLDHTTAFASALLGSLAPLFTLVLVALLKEERVRAPRWAGAIVALVGIAIFEGAFSGHAVMRLGDALTLVAAAIFAGYNVLSARLLARYTPLCLVTITMWVGAMMIVPGGAWAIAHTNFAALSWQTRAIFAYAVLFPILLTYPVWTWGIREAGAARVSIFSYLVPILAGLLSIPLLHTPIKGYEIAGSLISLAGMALATALARLSFIQAWTSRTLGIER